MSMECWIVLLPVLVLGCVIGSAHSTARREAKEERHNIEAYLNQLNRDRVETFLEVFYKDPPETLLPTSDPDLKRRQLDAKAFLQQKARQAVWDIINTAKQEP